MKTRSVHDPTNKAASCGLVSFAYVAMTMLVVAAAVVVSGCSSKEALQVSMEPGYERTVPEQTFFNVERASANLDAVLDVSSVAQGYVAASAVGETRLKLQIIKGDRSCAYDLPRDGEPFFAPISMGDGSYTFRIALSTSSDSYVVLNEKHVEVQLESEFEPFLASSSLCVFDDESASVRKANELAGTVNNEEEVVRRVHSWIVENIKYDAEKAAQLANASGYVPDPDATIALGKGVCFDYASLGAAMLRSQGVPCKIVTGTVSPDNVYHAWIEAYVDADWRSLSPGEHEDAWTLIDLTFDAGGAGGGVNEERTYHKRYEY